MDIDRFRIKPGSSLKLSKHLPGGPPYDRAQFAAKFQKNTEKIDQLQEILFAENKHRILILFQGMDSSGKDSVIRSVFQTVSPIGLRVVNFKKPTDQDLSHDYLWRIHKETPGRGEFVIFNRSHYEDVLVAKVHGEVGPRRIEKRFKQIQSFEQMLTEEGTTILKFFLHLSKKEQRQRLQERIDNPKKNWKFNFMDLKERTHWGQYHRAYQEAISATSTEHAPWYIIPSDHRSFRNTLVSEIISTRLAQLKMKYPKGPRGILGRIVSK